MIIPDFSAKPEKDLKEITDLEFYKKERAATTDRMMAILVVSEEDENTAVLKPMFQEMVSHYTNLKFYMIYFKETEAFSSLADEFDFDTVPTLVCVHPHKMAAEVIESITPDALGAKINESSEYYKQMFDSEKKEAFRDIDGLIKSSPCFMFIKGTLDAPKCKFTRKLVESLKPFNYINIKTLNILENERIR